jgi:hypothetical protein
MKMNSSSFEIMMLQINVVGEFYFKVCRRVFPLRAIRYKVSQTNHDRKKIRFHFRIISAFG